MKNVALFLTLISLTTLIQSCYYDYYDENLQACASTRYKTYEVGEDINFTNCSYNAESYLWDFGDGNVSSDKYPSHYYDMPGDYEVKLTAFGREDYDITYIDIEVVQAQYPTELNILIEFDGTTSPVRNCDVNLYKNYDDWYSFSNSISSGLTNNDGIIEFTNLNASVYYIDAYLKVDDIAYYSNENLGYYTDPLIPGQINYYEIFIKYETSNAGKGLNPNRGKGLIKILKPLSKPEFMKKLSDIQQKNHK